MYYGQKLCQACGTKRAETKDYERLQNRRVKLLVCSDCLNKIKGGVIDGVSYEFDHQASCGIGGIPIRGYQPHC